MPEDERLRLVAIAERVSLVRGWVEGMTEEDFVNDLMARDAAAMSLLVIGETAEIGSRTATRPSIIVWFGVS